jgi:hypothetical protein
MSPVCCPHCRNSLETKLNLSLPSTLAFDYPTQTAIVDYVEGLMGPGVTATAASAVAAAAGVAALPPAPAAAGAIAPSGRMVAVLASAQRLPGGLVPAAAAISAPGHLLDAISVVPLQRWDAEIRLTDDLPARFGSFLPGVEVRGSWYRGSCGCDARSTWCLRHPLCCLVCTAGM